MQAVLIIALLFMAFTSANAIHLKHTLKRIKGNIDVGSQQKIDIGTRDIKEEYFEKIQIPEYLKAKYPSMIRYEMVCYGARSKRQLSDIPFEIYHDNGKVQMVRIPTGEIAGWNRLLKEEPRPDKLINDWLNSHLQEIRRIIDEKDECAEAFCVDNNIDTELLSKKIEEDFGVMTSFTSNTIKIEL